MGFSSTEPPPKQFGIQKIELQEAANQPQETSCANPSRRVGFPYQLEQKPVGEQGREGAAAAGESSLGWQGREVYHFIGFISGQWAMAARRAGTEEERKQGWPPSKTARRPRGPGISSLPYIFRPSPYSST